MTQRVQFLIGVAPYNPGEMATFTSAEAAALLAQGVVQYVNSGGTVTTVSPNPPTDATTVQLTQDEQTAVTVQEVLGAEGLG